jgi:uncharacterized protein
MTDTREVLTRAEQLMARIEALLPAAPAPVDWSAPAYVWRRHLQQGHLRAVHEVGRSCLDDLLCIDDQKAQLNTNTRQFLAGLPANNVLLWGPRGTGKSSVIRALLNAYSDRGLRIIEVDRDHLIDIPAIIDIVGNRPERFILYCDDLSFEGRDRGYKALKVLLDGSVQSTPRNLLVYAESPPPAARADRRQS